MMLVPMDSMTPFAKRLNSPAVVFESCCTGKYALIHRVNSDSMTVV